MALTCGATPSSTANRLSSPPSRASGIRRFEAIGLSMSTAPSSVGLHQADRGAVQELDERLVGVDLLNLHCGFAVEGFHAVESSGVHSATRLRPCALAWYSASSARLIRASMPPAVAVGSDRRRRR